MTADRNELTIRRNYDDVFMRNVLIGFTHFMHDIIKIKEVKNGQIETKTVKCYYSQTGNQQYLTDLYLDPHQYSAVDFKVEGNYNEIPRGVFTINSSGVNGQNLSGGYERMEFEIEVETKDGINKEMVSAMTQFQPEEFSVELELKCTSEIERMKIYDVIIEKLYKVKKFYYRYRGFNKLPCHVTFPDNTNDNHQFKFRTNSNDSLPMLTVNIRLTAYRPIIDETTIMKRAERIQKQITRTKVKNL